MKTILLAILYSVVLLTFSFSNAARLLDANEINGLKSTENLLKNGHAEKLIRFATASGGTLTRVSAAALRGDYGFRWDSNGAAQTLTLEAVDVPTYLKGKNGYAFVRIAVPSGTATHKLQAFDGTNVLAEVDVVSSVSDNLHALNFVFPSSGFVALRILSVAANEPSIDVDDGFLGDALNLTDVAQSKIAVAAYYGVTCNATTGSASPVIPTNATCPGPTIQSSSVGTWLTTDNDGPVLIGQNLPPGKYVARFQTRQIFEDTVNRSVFMVMYAAGAQISSQLQYANSGVNEYQRAMIEGYYETTTAQSSVQFDIRVATDGIGITTLSMGGPANANEWVIYYYPLESETAVKPDSQGEIWDVNIGGPSDFGLGNTAISTYTGITTAAADMVINTDKGSKSAQIPCGFANPSTGLTCAAGEESLGIVIDISQAGLYEACANFSHYINSSSGGGATTTFQWVETPNNAQTILQEGDERSQSFHQNANGTSAQANIPHRNCGTFKFGSVGQKTLRIMYEQIVSTVINSNVILVDRNASAGQRDMHITVRKVVPNIQAPLIVNSVVSEYPGVTHINTITDAGATNYTATTSDETISFDTSGADRTLTLPPAANVKGKKYTIFTTSSLNSVIIDPSGAELVCSHPTVRVIGSRDIFEIQSTGTYWISDQCIRTVRDNLSLNGSSCTASNYDPRVSSAARLSIGVCQVYFATGAFNSNTSCTATGAAGGSTDRCVVTDGASPTTNNFRVTQCATNALIDASFNITCTGNR